MLNNGLFTSNSEEWATPRKLFDELNAEFGFTLDPCATPENAKCERYFIKEQDGLSQPWVGTVFCNPPYGKQLPLWVEKAYRECENGTTVVLLIPARTDTRYFHEYIYGKHEVRFLKGRLHFNESKQSDPFPSMIVVMRPTISDRRKTMAEEKKLIYADDLLNAIRDDHSINGANFAKMRRHIETAKAVEAVEVVRGKWIKGKYPGEYTCSRCGMEYCEADPADKQFKYCPECGSKNE